MSEELNITPEAAAPTESMDDYAAELEASFKQIREGDILTGTVIGVSENGVTLDLKYYTDGLIRPEDFSIDPSFNLKENVHVGDEISATVIESAMLEWWIAHFGEDYQEIDRTYLDKNT